jgi:hypothetical protein
MSSHLINSLLLKLHRIHSNNQIMITLLSVLRGFSTCFNWRRNMIENTSKCYSNCYCATLAVTAPQPLEFQLDSIAKIFTSSLLSASFPPSATATVIVYDCPVLCSSPSIVTTVRD